VYNKLNLHEKCKYLQTKLKSLLRVTTSVCELKDLLLLWLRSITPKS